ncbi:MAG: hypothetical protein AMDU4_FER2C00203G0003 [Ferroplasma sp. Type II]|uniref:hypothetical protein n=1 Tax=Ferroplasma sp. Type II TaxID=261388 RepID=UPI0003895C99|nr:hypothetical protein [Ferroplasma sp. Type II]EQB71021.1 MAG: hypothetical protein AMDU4_FER2C00203G0003 [Ferroplasma sp. Type II]
MFAEEARGVVKIEIGERRLSLNMDSDMIYYSLGDRTYRRTRMNDFIELSTLMEREMQGFWMKRRNVV